MVKLFKNICNKALIFTLCIVTFGSAIFSSISYAHAASAYNQLGTNVALGSPVLNNNFTTDQWNKWETIVWGIFLSNFCVPLIDDYSSAFTVGNGGSNGSGYKALCFSTGNDSSNNDVIESFCNYAVQQQKASATQIYVSYNSLFNSEILINADDINSVTDDRTQMIREATFQDLFMHNVDLNNATEKGFIPDSIKTNVDEVRSTFMNSTDCADYFVYDTDSYGINHSYDINGVRAVVPTFWVKTNDEKFEKILDYKDPWDIQVASLMISKVLSSDRSDDFFSKLEAYHSSNDPIRLDCFGNITTNDNKIIIPASTNRNLTKSGSINLVNSFVMNGRSENVNDQRLLESASQYVDQAGIDYWVGGVPALGGFYSKIPEGATYIYYDFDSVVTEYGDSANLGQTFKEFFDTCDINNKKHKYSFKIEAANILQSTWFKGIKDAGTGSNLIADMQLAAAVISTYHNTEQNNVLTEITISDGSKLSLFADEPLLIPVQLLAGQKNDSSSIITRELYNFWYNCYKGKIKETTSGSLSTSSIASELERGEIANGIDLGNYMERVGIWDTYKRIYKVNEKYKVNSMDWGNNETFNETNLRTILLYPNSEVYRKVGNILGVVDGTEFSVYSTYIYITYLDFYGITHSTDLLGDNKQTSDLKENIFELSGDVTNLDPEEVLGAKSDAELEKEVLNYSYLMLSPSAGRAYRTELITTGLSDWIYDTYSRIVFGTATKDGSSISTKSNSGFLNIDTYADNPLTAPFINLYSDIALTLIMVLIIVMLVFGLIKGRSASWFVLTAIMIVNTILLVPSTGEIVPYMTSNMVQGLFNDKMTFWSVSEAISNASMERDAAAQQGELSGLSEDEASQVVKLVKNLNVLYLDRSLMLKRDISAKVTQKLEGTYDNIQNIASARWLLPTIMRQYSDENSRSDYVYIKLSDMFDDFSNNYWYYNLSDAIITNDTYPTLTSGQNQTQVTVDDKNGGLSGLYTEVQSNFLDYNTDIYQFDDTAVKDRDIEFQSVCYTDSYLTPEKLIHNYSYIIDTLVIPSREDMLSYGDGSNDFSDVTDKFSAYVQNSSTISSTDAENTLKEIEQLADQYDRSDRGTMHRLYSYLWTTEMPTHYFYQLVKDTFRDNDMSLGKLIGDIQGKYAENIDGDEVRDTFMHATEKDVTGEIYPTGYTRDILDLQNMFTNTVPYLYQTQICTGGMDGYGGWLTDANGNPTLISDELSLYEGTEASWLFRCNWAVKLVECPDYNKSAIVRDSEGKKYVVSNMLFPECYPEERPMVFSEAQMHAFGLKEADLSIVELKCIEANEQVCNKWTMMLNYAGTANITLEVLERQMALDAALIFNEVFSPSGLFNSTYAMYPQTIDLRNISFDSIMKMLMLNVSKDTSYIYGDTMAALIDTTDIITSLTLLIVAFLCAYIIPGIRTLLMALIFYLGFLAILRTIFASNKYKAKVACGQLISNIIFLAITFLFYFVFYLLINLTSFDDVLITSKAAVKPGNPVWCLAVILIACILYIFAMCKMINFCYKNYRDMGIEVYSMIAHTATDKVKSGISGIRADLGKKADADSVASRQNAKTGTTAGNANVSSGGASVETVNVSIDSSTGKDGGNRTSARVQTSGSGASGKEEISNYNDKALKTKSTDADIAVDIDAKIKDGANKADDTKVKIDK